MGEARKIGPKISSAAPGVGQIVPGWVPPVLRRYWPFARDMAQRFCRNMKQDREEELLKIIGKDFESRDQG